MTYFLILVRYKIHNHTLKRWTKGFFVFFSQPSFGWPNTGWSWRVVNGFFKLISSIAFKYGVNVLKFANVLRNFSFFTILNKSLVNNKNDTGPKTDPCGSPKMIKFLVYIFEITSTTCFIVKMSEKSMERSAVEFSSVTGFENSVIYHRTTHVSAFERCCFPSRIKY